jgi:3-oxoacyl-[acyl-carrier-protein] synthase-3
MAYISFNDIGISGIAVCVPQKQIINEEFGKQLFDEESLHKTIQTTGVEKRHVCDEKICSSDLCYEAAKKLLNDKQINNEEIDILIFVSQTPDYRLPPTACLLQHRLGLSKNTASFDINMGCSGYVYGLSAAFTYANMPSVRKVLLLVGDTVTKFVSWQDKASAMLFGDAGSATLIEKKNYKISYFSLNTDGGEFNTLHIKGGGYRVPSSTESLKDSSFDDGNIRNNEQLFMDGGEIFNFTIREVPKDIKGLLDYAKIPIENINHFILHQANKYMLDFLVKKIKCPPERVAYSLQTFGNTSSVSIPVTIAGRLKDELNRKPEQRILISGFGVGLSWATAVLTLDDCYISDIIEL